VIDLDAMMILAIQRDGLDITPCDGKKFSECYREHEGVLYFYYNTPDGNTRTISETQ
jgi:hypothetical protein